MLRPWAGHGRDVHSAGTTGMGAAVGAAALILQETMARGPCDWLRRRGAKGFLVSPRHLGRSGVTTPGVQHPMVPGGKWHRTATPLFMPPTGCLQQGPICPKSKPGLVCLSPLCSQPQGDVHCPRSNLLPFPSPPPQLQNALWGRRRWSLCPFKTRRCFANASCSPATHAPLQCPFHAQPPSEQ